MREQVSAKALVQELELGQVRVLEPEQVQVQVLVSELVSELASAQATVLVLVRGQARAKESEQALVLAQALGPASVPE